MRDRGLVVALDGLGSSGKSSVGAAVAAALGARFLDTGLLYRALAWLSLERGLEPEDGPAIAQLAAEIDLEADEAGRLAHVLVGGRDVADRIRTPRWTAPCRRWRASPRYGRRFWAASGRSPRPVRSSSLGATSGGSSCPTPT
jgi:cytidylate kinase